MSIETDMAGYYAARADEYEQIYQKPERQADLQTLRDFVAARFAGTGVLEVACGTGYWTAILDRSAASVMATDINNEVLTIARSRRLSRRVEFRRADAYALGKPSPTCNAGLSAFWWSHVPRRRLRDFLRGFHRALAPGARMVFIDNVYAAGSSTPISRTDENGDTFQLRRLSDGSVHEVLKNFPTASELRNVVRDLGSDVQVGWLQYYWTLSYVVRPDP